MIGTRSLARAALVVLREFEIDREELAAFGVGTPSSVWGYFYLGKELAEAAGVNISEPGWGDRLREIASGEPA